MKRRDLLATALTGPAVTVQSVRAQDTSMTDVEIKTDIPYGEADGQPLVLDVHRLPGPLLPPHPAVILLHGASTRGVNYPA